MPELLFELGCEEIPAEDLFVLPGTLKTLAEEAFAVSRIVVSSIETFATPRRLVLRAELSRKQKDIKEERLGPPAKIAWDPNGHPTLAAIGFAKNAGVPVDKLRKVETSRGEYLAIRVTQKGRRTEEVLKEILPEIVRKLPFKKYMRWGSQDFLFGRPIRNLLLLFGSKALPLTIAGVASGRQTFGHRFLSKRKRITVKSYSQYRTALAENGVILSFNDRVSKIEAGLQEQSTTAKGKLKADPDLLRTMANEVEFPEILMGSFAPEFLSLPHEILINAMRKHQKYFCGVDDQQKLLPVFFTVLNTHATKADLIRTGHERVLQARLRDAEFFWREDLKIPLVARRSMLDRLTYYEKLGSYGEKVMRMLQIAHLVLSQIGRLDLDGQLQELIRECKVDLLTLMVGEFPELQGIMAGLYAKQEGYPESKWMALYDQYLPVSAEDPVPRNLSGALLSVVDRIEALASGFTLNMIPTGSRDPYALRRVATGLMKIVLEYGLDVDFAEVFDLALSLYNIRNKLTPAEMKEGLMELMVSRFRFLMEQKGVAYDHLNAVLAVEQKSFLAAFAKTNALWATQNSGDLKTLAKGFKRINNIIGGQPEYDFEEELLQEDGEIRLYRAFSDLEFRVGQNIQVKDYSDALDMMVTLGPEIDNFFDEVLVMSEDERLRKNRIALLQKINDLYRKIADFSALQIEL